MINTRGLPSSIRDRILSAAFQSLKDNGFSGTSTLEIATKAHVSKRELYALFPSKDKILFACIAERASAISGSISELPEPDTTRELYVADSVATGIKRNRKRLLIRRSEVVAISLLEDVVDE